MGYDMNDAGMEKNNGHMKGMFDFNAMIWEERVRDE